MLLGDFFNTKMANVFHKNSMVGWFFKLVCVTIKWLWWSERFWLVDSRMWPCNIEFKVGVGTLHKGSCKETKGIAQEANSSCLAYTKNQKA
jgi:hypothetical protein